MIAFIAQHTPSLAAFPVDFPAQAAFGEVLASCLASIRVEVVSAPTLADAAADLLTASLGPVLEPILVQLSTVGSKHVIGSEYVSAAAATDVASAAILGEQPADAEEQEVEEEEKIGLAALEGCFPLRRRGVRAGKHHKKRYGTRDAAVEATMLVDTDQDVQHHVVVKFEAEHAQQAQLAQQAQQAQQAQDAAAADGQEGGCDTGASSQLLGCLLRLYRGAVDLHSQCAGTQLQVQPLPGQGTGLTTHQLPLDSMTGQSSLVIQSCPGLLPGCSLKKEKSVNCGSARLH